MRPYSLMQVDDKQAGDNREYVIGQVCTKNQFRI
jgi:hypothetical protein